MKKVLFVATITEHINIFHTPYLKMFKEKGYEVHVASRGKEDIPFCDNHFNIPFERNPLKAKNIKAYKQLKKIINKEKYEIIHCHTPVGGVLTRLAAKKSRKINNTIVIYTAHGFHFYKGAPILNWLIYYPIEKICSRWTDCLITINKEDYYISKDKFKAKQTKLVNGVGVEEKKFKSRLSKEQLSKIKEKFKLNDDDFILIQVGELNKNKNQIMSINAMRELVKERSNIHLLIVGQGTLEKYYIKKINKYGLNNNIHMLGYRKDIADLLKISNVLLSLSYREGLPVNVIEALISNKAVIATNCRGNRDLIENEINGFIIPLNDKNELNKRILEICDNKLEFSNVNVQKYELDNVIKEHIEIYNDIIKRGQEINI